MERANGTGSRKELEAVSAKFVRRRDTRPLNLKALTRFLQHLGMEQTSLKRSLEDANQNTPVLTGRPTKQAKISTFFAPAADTTNTNPSIDAHGAGSECEQRHSQQQNHDHYELYRKDDSRNETSNVHDLTKKAASPMTRKCPNMNSRSRDEIYYHCEWLSRLGMLTMNNLVDALNEGDKRGAMDACFVDLPGVPDHGSEYDGGYFHTENRIRADIDKTHRMLKNPNLLICRIRVNAPELPLKNERLIVVHINNRCDAVNAMSKRFAEHVTNTTVQSRLLSCHHFGHNIDCVARDFLMWPDTEYKFQFEELSINVGATIAQKLLRVNGIKSRLANGSVVRILDRLCCVRGFPPRSRRWSAA
eukprot:5202070-Prymnesium_polylepis.1